MKKKYKILGNSLKNILGVALISGWLITFTPTELFANNNANNVPIEQAVKKTVTINSKGKSLDFILSQIKQQTQISYGYQSGNGGINKNMLFSLSVSKVSVDEALKTLFAGSPYTFSLKNNMIFVVAKSSTPANASTKSQKIEVKGKVVDHAGNAIAGAAILVKSNGSSSVNIGTATDGNGDFKFSCERGSVLEVSFLGMQTQTVEAASNLTIKLVDDMVVVDDIVITGYQHIDKRKNTSAIQSLKMDELKIAGVQTIDNLLESKVPGMIFMQNSGQIGATPKIRIRGTSTVLGNQEPLWVLDGVVLRDPVNVDPQLVNNLDFVNLVGNAVSGINPEDIERIDILKDASSTALYGAKAANGVIVITTKKGKEGPPSVSYNFSGKFTDRPRYSDKSIFMMNSRDRIDYSREIVEKGLKYPTLTNWVGYEGALKDLYTGKINQDQFSHLVSRLESVNTDWFKTITESTFSQSHTFNLSGGNSNVRYYASLGYSNENGVIKGEKNDRYTASLNINGSYDKFQYSIGMMANKGEREYVNPSLNVLDYAYNTSRAVPVYNEDGSLYYYDKVGTSNASQNVPLAFNIINEMNNFRDQYENFGINLNANLSYRFSDELKLQGTFGYGISNSVQETFIGENTYYAGNLRGTNFGQELSATQKTLSLLPFGGEYRDNVTRNNNYTGRIQIDFNKFIDSDMRHQITSAVGFEVSSTKYAGKQQTNRCYLPERGMSIASVDPVIYKGFADWKMTDLLSRGLLSDNINNELAAYLTVSYTFDNTYTVNFNTRADASNKFGSRSNEKILPVWSVSGSWDAKSKLLKNIKAVNTLTLRGSYGYQGNMLDSQTPELIIKKGDLNSIYDEYTSDIVHYPNPNLNWEKTHAFNTSLDFGFFENRLRGTVSYFYKKTIDAFLSKEVSDINGVDTYIINSGNIENKGFEVSLNFTPIKSSGNAGGFRWDIDPQFGQIVNTLLSKAVNNKNFNEPQGKEIKYTDYLNGSVLVEGKPMNSFYSYRYAGLSSVDGRPMFNNVDENLKDKYIKMNAEDVYREVLDYSGTRIPVIQGGISNTLSYRRLSLGINFSYSLGSKIRLMSLYSSSKSSTTVAPLPERNVRGEFNDRWRVAGDEKRTNIPGLLNNTEYAQTLVPWWTQGDANAIRFADNIWQMYDNSNLRVASGNYFKLQSFTLNYTIPEKLCKKIYMKSAHVSFSGYNIFTVCSKSLKGQDPTQSGSAENINLSLRPSYSLSVGLTF